MYTVTELESNQEKMLIEISRLWDYVVKLEFRINVQEKQILDLKAHSIENNIINGHEKKKQPEQMKENLAKILQNIFEKELELDKEAVENLQINSLYRMEENDSRRKTQANMCPIIKQNVLRHSDEPNVSVEREKSKIRIARTTQ